MRALGIAVQPSGTSMRVRCVVLTGTQAAPATHTTFELTSPCRSAAEVAPMLGNLARGLETRLAGVAPDRIAIARANVGHVGSRQENRLRRLLVEGALAAVAHGKCAETIVDHRSDLASRATGVTNLSAVVDGLVSADYAEAATAALSMLDP
jgi:hypothetical protein